MKSVFHYIQYKKNQNNMIRYSDNYITDGFSIEPINETNSIYLNKRKQNNMIQLDSKYSLLDEQTNNLFKQKEIGKYTGGYFYYVSGLPCDLEGYWIVGEGENNYPPRGEYGSKYLNITNGINMYKVTQF